MPFETINISSIESTIRRKAGKLDDRCKASVAAGAKVLRDALRERLEEQNVSGRATGGLARSIKADAPDITAADGCYSDVHPDGTDEHGTRYAEIGGVLEYGRISGSRRVAHYPWMAPTVELERANVTAAIRTEFEKGAED